MTSKPKHANSASLELDEIDDGADGLVPYAPDFTPATLGRRLGEEKVLSWLLELGAGCPLRRDFISAVGGQCLSHIRGVNDRRDMASHVLQGMQNYGLVLMGDDGKVFLTEVGRLLAGHRGVDLDREFARHILTACNGYRLVEEITRCSLRGKSPTLEELAEELDRRATSKNISTMRAWLVRAGVLREGRRYVVDEDRVEEILGTGARKLFGLSGDQVEFLLAARLMETHECGSLLDAADVRLEAEARAPGVRIPSKALGSFVDGLVKQGLFCRGKNAAGRGGSRVTIELTERAHVLTDGQVRGLVAQAWGGMRLSELKPLPEIMAGLVAERAEEAGRLGEMVAVHLCLMLGLRVVSWRRRAPAAEIDLVAERIVGLGYQRWHVQVKNTTAALDIDHVDREIGAAAGTGATHLLFVVLRAGVSSAARSEILTKAMITPLHVFHLSADVISADVDVSRILRSLRAQEAHLARLKRMEAERREQLG